MPTEVRAPHRAGLVEMRKRSLDVLGAVASEPAATRPAQTPTIGVDERLCVGQVTPAAAAPIGFGDVRAHAERVEIDEGAVAGTIAQAVATCQVSGLSDGSAAADKALVQISTSWATVFTVPGRTGPSSAGDHGRRAWSIGIGSPRHTFTDVHGSGGAAQKGCAGGRPSGRNATLHRYRLPVEM